MDNQEKKGMPPMDPQEEIHLEEIPFEDLTLAAQPPMVEEEPVLEELPVEEGPVLEDLPVEETPVLEDLPVEETPVMEDLPMEEDPVLEELPIEKVPIGEELPLEAPPPLEEATAPEGVVPPLDFPAGEAPASAPEEGDIPSQTSPELAAILENTVSLDEALAGIDDLLTQDATPRELPRKRQDSPVLPQEPPQEAAPAEAAPEEPPKTVPVPPRKRPPRKGRPKKTGGEGLWGIPSILSTVVWLALIVAIGITAGRMVWVCAADVLAFGREDKVVTVTVYEKDSMDDITQKLYDAGLIRYRSLFQLYATFSHAEEDIKPGIYDLNTRYDYHALVNFMSPSSNRAVVKVTIPEGYTCAQIFSLLEENKVCTAVDIAAYAATGDLEEYWFLDGVERGQSNCLEGFLFPDTYEFYKNDSPRNILQKMLNNFDTRFDEEMRQQIDSLNQHLAGLMRSSGRSEETIAQNLFTVREVVTVASMIEKETAHSGESPVIASVIYNRLFNWGDNPAYLNIDASIVYALNGKTDLTREDLQVDSPYNTYLNTGLTPTPIANPGLASLRSALNPESTNYYFYVLDPVEGSHRFSTTREEHEANVAQFSEIQG